MIERKHMESLYLVIEANFGIELGWAEKAALSHYLSCFIKKRDRQRGVIPWMESTICFMKDYFGFDMEELGRKKVYTFENGRPTWKEYGMGLLGTEEFKEYCNRRVQMIRDERNLI